MKRLTDVPQRYFFSKSWRLLVSIVFLYGATNHFALEAETNTRPSVGIRSHTPNFHALTGLRIVTKPGELIDLGTIVIKHGVITSVSIGNTVPDGCRVWDFSGKTAYAGFIDSFSEARESVAHSGGDRYWNPHIRPARSVGNFKEGGESLNVSLRKQGVLLRLVAPKEGVIKGQSILVSTGSGKLSDRLVSASAAMHVRLTVPFNRERDDYPNSPMGAVALARQAMYDTEWYGRAWKVFRNRTGL
ncbi:hypothetical protein OAG77_00985, partial [bacterium]|nr:hypothetical protein [bacterium]